MITIEELAEVTVSVLDGAGFDGFEPILLDPETQTVRNLSGIPSDIEHRQAAIDWAQDLALRTYALAFRFQDGIALVCVNEGHTQKALLILEGDNYGLVEGNLEF